MSTVLHSLNTALHRSFADDRVYLLGEDLLDPYGGAFKVSSGLSSAYPDRVLTSPISEAGIVGLAAGMALRGLRPVVEIMFGDFLTLIADQVINHLSKFRWMYNDSVSVPLVIRTPMGGRRGYGPTHSQTLEKLFLGVPGMRVLASSAFTSEGGDDPGVLLEHAILRENDPVLFLENKLLYLVELVSENSTSDLSINTVFPKGGQHESVAEPITPHYSVSVRGAPPPVVTVAAYGYMAELARQAMLLLAYENEIFLELQVPTLLSPFILDPVFESVRHTGKLLILEEGTRSMGWGAEVAARCAEHIGTGLETVRRLAAMDLPVPASGVLEEQVLPGVEDIVQIVKEMV